MKPMDETSPVERQLAAEAAPAVLINLLTLDGADKARFPEAWTGDARSMRRQPGIIPTQLHRAIGESPTYLNHALWESTGTFRAAFTHPEFTARLSAYPSTAVASPHLFQQVAANGICAG